MFNVTMQYGFSGAIYIAPAYVRVLETTQSSYHWSIQDYKVKQTHLVNNRSKEVVLFTLT